MPYLIVFSLSSFLTYLSNLEKINNKYKRAKYIFIILSILLVSIFAGLRNDTVGTDMLVYGNNVFFDSAKYSDFFTYYRETQGWFKVEPVYMFLNFFSSRIVKSPYFFYFLLSLIINISIYMSITNFKDKLNITYAWMSYLLIYYGYTFNLLRQSLAIGFALLAFTYLYKSNYKLSSVFIVLAWGSHFSSIPISILVVFLFFILKKIRHKMRALVILLLVLTASIFAINPIVEVLINGNLIPDKYMMYVTNLLGVGFSLKSISLKVPVAAIFAYCYKYLSNESEEYYFFLFIFLFDFIFYQLRIVNVTFSRMSLYMFVFQIISIPYMINRITDSVITFPVLKRIYSINLNSELLMRIYMLYLAIVWFYQFVIVGINEIYPYTSDILNIG